MLHRAAPVITRAELFLVGLLTLVALIVRFYHIERPSSVVFDEVHFGGFASKYLSRKFFMDVHPPLAKLLFAAGHLVQKHYAAFSTPSLAYRAGGMLCAGL